MRKYILLFLLLATVSYAQIPPLGIQDEGGTENKPVFTLDCVGAGVSCSHSGIKGTITVSGSGSATISGEDQNVNISSTVDTVNTLTGLTADINPAGQWNVYINESVVSTATSLDGLSDIGSSANTSGNILIADGTNFDSVAIFGDLTIGSSGESTIQADSISLSDLSDVGTTTLTSGNILVGDGNSFESVAMTGDITMTSAGVTDIGTNVVGEIELNESMNFTTTGNWTFNPNGTGAFGAYDITIGGGKNGLGGIRIGDGGIYKTSYSTGNIDLGQAFVMRNENSLEVGNDPGIEFAFIESVSNTIRLAIPESGSGNATAFIRSGTFAGPYSTAIGNDIVTCDQWTTYDSNIDCDTSGTGADLFVQDDIELEGVIFLSGTNIVHFDSDDANSIQLTSANATADRTITLPNETGTVCTTGSVCSGYSSVSSLSDLSDVGVATATDGNILIGDGTNFDSKVVSGDLTLDYNGNFTIQANSVALTTDTTGNYTATIADAGNSTITVVNGSAEGGAVTLDAVDLNCTDCINATEIEDIYILNSGDSYTGTHNFTSATLSGISLNDLSDVVTSVDTSGNILIADGSGFDAVAVSGDVTINSSGVATVRRTEGTVTICSSTATVKDMACDYVADGTADEVQVQAAIDAIELSGVTYGQIVMTEGTFTFAAPVVIEGTTSPYVRIGISCAEGWGTTITGSNSFSGNNLFEFTETTADPTAAFLMEDCLLSGNKSNITIGAFDTKVGGANNVPLWDLQFHRVIMFSFGANVITLDNPWGFVFENSQIEDSDECGIVISQGGTGTGNAKQNGAQIIGSKLIQLGQDTSPTCKDAIKLTGVYGTRIIGNELSSQATGGYGVHLNGADFNLIQGNDFGSGSSSTGGLYVDSTSDKNVINGNNFRQLSGVALSIVAGATSNVSLAGTFSNVTGTEIQDAGTTTNIAFNVGDDSGTFLAQLSTGNLDLNGGKYLVSGAEDAFAYASDTDAAMSFGAVGYQFTDLNGTIVARHDLGGTMQTLPQATAPATCSIGEWYVDTSGAYCGCTASNTWSNFTGTGTCS